MMQRLPRGRRGGALRLIGWGALAAALLVTRWGMADTAPTAPTVNDFGGTGLLQTPTARMRPDGQFTLGASRVSPYTRMYITLQALPWLEGTFRYTDIANREFTPDNPQSYKDKAGDLKLLLREESRYWPAVAVGVRDLGGTALFASEYLVASKRYYNWDFHLGLGWGNLGTRGDLPNPLGLLWSGMNTRPVFQAGEAATGTGRVGTHFFRGEQVSVIGGIEYHLPWKEDIRIKLELDGNDYQTEPLDNAFEQSLPINLGVTYRPWEWMELAAGFERGNTFMVQASVPWDLNGWPGMPKLDDPPPQALILPRPQVVTSDPAELAQQVPSGAQAMGIPSSSQPGRSPSAALPASPEAVAQAIIAELEKSDFTVEGVHLDAHSATIFAGHQKFRHLAQAAGRAARIAANRLPPAVEMINYVNVAEGVQTAKVSILRKELEKAASYNGSPEELWEHIQLTGGAPEFPAGTIFAANRYPDFEWGITPKLRHNIGGADSFYFWQVWMQLSGELDLTPGWSVSGALGANIYNNYSTFGGASNSLLPHVRTDIKEYLREGEYNITDLETDYIWEITDDWYARATAGLFEEMFGGVGGEVLYRPYGSRWAAGLDLNRVRQRDYDQLFSFRDYEVTTGHLSLYYETPFHDILGIARAGQYLAGDKGVTMELSRRFDNGVRIGAFATKTNVSSTQFGEGSFDKGAFIYIPVDYFFTRSTKDDAPLVFRPIQRDGGQRLNINKPLYSVTEGNDPGSLNREWNKVLK